MEGGTLAIEAGVAASEFLGYQWMRNGIELPGAVGPTLLIANVQLNDAGEYSVRVSTPCGLVTSSNATVRVFGRCSLSGYVWNDINANSEWDQVVLAELSLPGVVIYVDTDNNGSLGITERFTVSTETGFYCFTNLASGNYVVRQQVPEGYFENFPGAAGDHQVHIQMDHPTTNWNFGNKALNRFIPAKDGITIKNFIQFQGDFAELRYGADRGVAWRVDRKLSHNTNTSSSVWTTVTNIVGSTNAVTIRDRTVLGQSNVIYRAVRQ